MNVPFSYSDVEVLLRAGGNLRKFGLAILEWFPEPAVGHRDRPTHLRLHELAKEGAAVPIGFHTAAK